MLRCPICKLALARIEKTYCCAQQHAFDIAREGYVHLLPARAGTPRSQGDAPEMLKARRGFLEQGYFDFLAQALLDRLRQELLARSLEAQPYSVLDVGCGEGYYLGFLSRALSCQSSSLSIAFYGMDLSKAALRMAARTHKHCSFFLANVQHEIPMQDNSLDFLLVVCAPRNFSEFARVVKPHGRLLIVIPTPRHLIELRDQVTLLKIDPEKEQEVIARAKQFRLRDSSVLERSAELSAQAAQALLTMTPNFWHRADSPVELQPTRVTFSFRFLMFEVLPK